MYDPGRYRRPVGLVFEHESRYCGSDDGHGVFAAGSFVVGVPAFNVCVGYNAMEGLTFCFFACVGTGKTETGCRARSGIISPRWSA